MGENQNSRSPLPWWGLKPGKSLKEEGRGTGEGGNLATFGTQRSAGMRRLFPTGESKEKDSQGGNKETDGITIYEGRKFYLCAREGFKKVFSHGSARGGFMGEVTGSRQEFRCGRLFLDFMGGKKPCVVKNQGGIVIKC